jgi:SAM-dependent methyltransferase
MTTPQYCCLDRDLECCLFCAGRGLSEHFSQTILGKYQASYEFCDTCRSLQISKVFWLEESYGPLGFHADTGSVQRSIACAFYIRAMRHTGFISRAASILDFGAGSGLLVRLLRDFGFHAHGYDRYTSPLDCAGFVTEQLDQIPAHSVDLITMIEVFEHLPNPLETLQSIAPLLNANGQILIRSELFDDKKHGPDWAYITPEHGQHINFPSAIGLQRLACRLGLTGVHLPFGFFLFQQPYRPLPRFRRAALLAAAALPIGLSRCLGLCNFKFSMRDKRNQVENKGVE